MAAAAAPFQIKLSLSSLNRLIKPSFHFVSSSPFKTLGFSLPRLVYLSLRTLESPSRVQTTSEMEFWGVEVKAGQSLKVQPDDDQVIHISQASLGESKKGQCDSVPLYVKFGDQKLVLGTLSSDKFPQISFDLVFEKEFELSHNWSGGSVYFMGYKSVLGDDEDHEHSDFDSDEDDIPIQIGGNGRIELAPVPAAEVMANATKKSEKPKATIADMDEDDSDDDDSEDDSDDEEGSDESDSDDAEDGSSEDDEETPKKQPEVSKKRTNEAGNNKTANAKKAKLVTPQKTDGKKKEVHTATPHPKKQEAKTATGSKKSPKSGGQVSCGTCSKTFNSETGLQSHTKAKHSGGK